MGPETKQSIIDVLNKLDLILAEKYISLADLKSLGNKLMYDISLFQDNDCISLSVLIHSLYKIFSKNSDLDRKTLRKLIKKTLSSVHNEARFSIVLKKIFIHLNKYDNHLDRSVVQILKHAQVKKGLKIYEYGVSISEAAKTIGVSKWEIMAYLGSSNILDREFNEPKNSKQRLAFTRRLFK
jgi:hypothetical protein